MPVYPAEIGLSIASVDVDQAVIACLRRWLPTYLGIIKQQKNLTYNLPSPRHSSFSNTIDEDQFPDSSLPGIFVATARTEGEVTELGTGDNAVEWLVAVSALVRGRTPAETRVTASYYELAIRMALVQQLASEQIINGGFDALCRWHSGGEARPIADPNGRGRWLGEGASQFGVYTTTNVKSGVGPTEPDKEPYDALASVDTVSIDVVGEPQNATLGG